MVGFIETKKATVDKIAKRLLEIETIGDEEFKSLIGEDSGPR